MARIKLRSKKEVVERARELAGVLRGGLAMLPGHSDDRGVIDALWGAEGLGTLLWSLRLAELPPYDTPFDADWLVDLPMADGVLRPADEVDQARETARLWHWRARTSMLAADNDLELPEQWQSIQQLVAATAMRSHERGLLPSPLRGDFPVLGGGYRELGDDDRAEALSIAFERHRALNWLCGIGRRWDETPTDT